MTNKTNKRIWLKVLVKLCCLFLLGAFLMIFVKGLFWSPNLNKDQRDNIVEGEPTIIRANNKRLWLVRFNEAQRRQWLVLSAAVHAGGCQPDQQTCSIVADMGNGIVLQYLQVRPPQIESDTPWIGGYVNPVNGAVYDLFGRGYLNNPSAAEPVLMLETAN